MVETEWQDLGKCGQGESEYPMTGVVNGEEIVIFKNGDELCGVQRLCPHQDGDFLKKGMLIGNGKMIRCMLHGFVFKLDTGKGVNAGQHCINIFDIRQEDGRLMARKKIVPE